VIGGAYPGLYAGTLAPAYFLSSPSSSVGVPWTTTPRKVWPPAADNVSVTPSASNFGNSAWVQVVASTSSACLLAGVVVRPTIGNVNYEIDVGTGGAGAETVIATLIGATPATITGLAQSSLLLPILIDSIATATRVAVRMRKSGTNVTAWGISVLYYEKPVTGTLITTTKPSKCLPSAADAVAPTSGTGIWANGAYVQITASAAADLVLIGVSALMQVASTRWEVDIAVGAAASEVVITTIRGTNLTSIEAPNTIALPTPLDAIPSGSRVSCRVRRDDGGNTVARAIGVKILYQEKPL
jgi:hypothetical protein